MIKYAAFDLEIAKVVDDNFDWEIEWPLGISCAAVAIETGSYFEIGNWWERGQMSKRGCREIVRGLQAIVDKGYTIVTWNGAAFDFKVLAEESGMIEECALLAINHVDLMYIVVARKGYFLGLDKAAVGLEIPGKLKRVVLKDGTEITDMHGGLAPQLWEQGEYQVVLDYLAEDVRVTLQLAQAIKLFNVIRWTSNSGRPMQFKTEMFTVMECLQLPLPNTRWMTDPPNRWDMLDWIPDEILRRL